MLEGPKQKGRLAWSLTSQYTYKSDGDKWILWVSDWDPRRINILIFYTEGGENDVIHRDNEDGDKDDVVHDCCSLVLFRIVNVHPTDYYEENAHHDLK